MIKVHSQLMICRGYIRASKGTLQIFLRLTVLCENWHFSQISHFFFILAAISKGHPHLQIKSSLCVWKRVQGSQSLNGIELSQFFFKSYCIFSDFVVPCGPHVPVVPTSSLLSPHHPHHSPCHLHIVHVIPMSSPCPHGCGLHVVSVVSTLHGPIIPTSSLVP